MIVSSVLFGLMHFIPSIGAISLNELCLQSIQYVLAVIAFCLVYIKEEMLFWDSSSYEHQFDA